MTSLTIISILFRRTDALGRDTLNRLIYVARTSLTVGLSAISIAAAVGMTLGMIAGYFGGLAHILIMRVIDVLMAFPGILLALVIGALLGGGLTNIVIALSVGLMSTYDRLMCGQVLTVKECDYILAEKSIGAGSLRIMFSHVFPNCMPPLIVMITMQPGAAILAEAGLSYPGIAIMLVVFAFNMVGDGLRDTLEPRLRAIL